MSPDSLRVEILEKLKKARSLVDRGWTRFQYAVDENHAPCGCTKSKARKWCSTGAILAANGYDDNPLYGDNKILNHCKDVFLLENKLTHIIFWNDAPDRTKKQVLEAFDHAIEKLSDPMWSLT